MNERLNESLVNRAAGFAHGAKLQGQVGKTSYRIICFPTNRDCV